MTSWPRRLEALLLSGATANAALALAASRARAEAAATLVLPGRAEHAATAGPSPQTA